MKRLLILRPRAIDELKALADYIAKDQPSAARRLGPAATETSQIILESPEACPRVELRGLTNSELRKRAILGFPNHIIYYVVTPQAVEIRRVLHGSRDVPAALFR